MHWTNGLSADSPAIAVLRFSTAIFLISLWAWYKAYGVAVYITPELKTTTSYVAWLQLALGLCARFRPILPLTGAGIFALYALAVIDYGVFHLLDYVIFLGLGYVLLVAYIGRGKWRQSGFVVLYAATGLTLIWAAVEKFAYPQWTYDLLRANPAMLMGMHPEYYMVLAGFVEFNLAFILLGAASIVARVVAVGFQSIFAAGHPAVRADRRDRPPDDHCDPIRAVLPRADQLALHTRATRKISLDGSLFHDRTLLPRLRHDLRRLLRSALPHLPRIAPARSASEQHSTLLRFLQDKSIAAAVFSGWDARYNRVPR